MAGDDDRSTERAEMVEQIMLHGQVAAGERGGITLSPRVLQAMGTVPRHEFVPEEVSEFAYADSPLPIGQGKTISQPFIVALMVELLDIQPEDRVLEVGTGLGYHAAVLASLAVEVYTVELIPELAESAAGRLVRPAPRTSRCGPETAGADGRSTPRSTRSARRRHPSTFRPRFSSSFGPAGVSCCRSVRSTSRPWCS